MTDALKPCPIPDPNTGLPLCANEQCPAFDGKRCRILGFRPDRFCEPALIEQRRAPSDAEAKLTRVREIVGPLSQLADSCAMERRDDALRFTRAAWNALPLIAEAVKDADQA